MKVNTATMEAKIWFPSVSSKKAKDVLEVSIKNILISIAFLTDECIYYQDLQCGEGISHIMCYVNVLRAIYHIDLGYRYHYMPQPC